MAKLTIAENEAFSDVATFTYDQLQAIGNGGQAVIATIPAGGGLTKVVVDKSVAFAGTTSLVIDIGTTGADPDEFIDALDVDAMTDPVCNTGDAFSFSPASEFVGATTSDTPVLLEVTDAAIASATAGKITIGLKIVDLRRFA